MNVSRTLSAGTLLLVLSCGVSVASAQTPQSWAPPVGIPNPGFGITDIAPARPASWSTTPSTATANFYYICGDCPNATDSNNPYGHPSSPRLTIPNQVFPAGTYVEVHGVYSVNHYSSNNIRCAGTASSPCWFRGQDAVSRPRLRASWAVNDSSYTYLENLKWEPNGTSSVPRVDISGTSDHIVFRRNEISGLRTISNPGLNIQSAERVHHVVIYGNSIHDLYDINATGDPNDNCIGFGRNHNNIWILENTLSACAGNGVMSNGGSLNYDDCRYIYVGRNMSHGHQQASYAAKYCADLVFSENVAHDHRPGRGDISDPGGCFNFQYGPEHLWVINNTCYNAELGVWMGAPAGPVGTGTGRNAYFVGNVFSDIHQRVGSGDAATIHFGSSSSNYNVRVINNTFSNVDYCVYGNSSSTGAVWTILNNICSEASGHNGVHVDITQSAVASNSQLDYNLFYGSPVRIEWGSETQLSVEGIQSAFGQCAHCISANPGFIAVGADFALLPNSPAVGAGLADAGGVYSSFQTLYGLSIAFDRRGAPRPQGAGWEMGAFEVGDLVEGFPRSPGNVRIIR